MSKLIDECLENFSKKQLFYQDADGEIYLGVTLLCVNLTFQINIAGGGALPNAEIVINGQTLTADASGQALICISPGTYNYTVTIAGYTTINGSVVVVGEQTETVNMFLTEATALFARRTSAPSSARANLDNKLIYDLIDNSLWIKFDCFWMFAAEDTQAANLNWIKNAHDCTLVNAPVFTVDRGYTGAATKYLNTNYNPSTQGVNYILNSASCGVYSRTDAGITAVDMGCFNGTQRSCFLDIRETGAGLFYGLINTNGVTNYGAVADSLALFEADRSGANLTTGIKRGMSVNTVADVSSSIVSLNVFILARNSSGVADTFSTRQLSFAYIGGSMTVPQHLTLYNLIQAYLTVLGAQV